LVLASVGIEPYKEAGTNQELGLRTEINQGILIRYLYAVEQLICPIKSIFFPPSTLVLASSLQRMTHAQLKSD